MIKTIKICCWCLEDLSTPPTHNFSISEISYYFTQLGWSKENTAANPGKLSWKIALQDMVQTLRLKLVCLEKFKIRPFLPSGSYVASSLIFPPAATQWDDLFWMLSCDSTEAQKNCTVLASKCYSPPFSIKALKAQFYLAIVKVIVGRSGPSISDIWIQLVYCFLDEAIFEKGSGNCSCLKSNSKNPNNTRPTLW